MIITEDTKISDILNEDISAIEVIARVNKNFKKLKNPFLRKLFAPRVSVKDAAKIGGVTAGSILDELKKNGFKVKYSDKTDNTKHDKIKLNMDKNKIITLDVRPILATGTDPYHAIIDTLKDMSQEETLLIINTFEPVPLLNKLQSQGYEYEVERPDADTVYTYLQKTDKTETEKTLKDETGKEDDFDDIKRKYEGKMHETDVRDLEMPMPMVTILEEIEKINDDEALFVHHKRLPQYLLPELETRGWVYVSKEIDENNMKFIIYKK